MSQSQTVSVSTEPLSKTPGNTVAIHHTQVAPQESVSTDGPKSKGTDKATVATDPHFVKSPLPTGSHGSRPASRTASLKGSFGSKSGFLSLLLCCTFGGGSQLDQNDKPVSAFSRNRKKIANNNHRDSRASTTTEGTGAATEKPLPAATDRPLKAPATLPKIFTGPNELAQSDGSADQDVHIDMSVTAATPRSLPPQSPEGQIMWLLPPLASEHSDRKCLVLDLDETLVHSSFKIIPNPDFIVPVEIDNQYHNVYVLKRPGVDEFMRKMGELYEIVVFTASLSKYADPVLDILDIHRVVKHRLFRESCCNHKGTYVKDLSQLGRDLAGTLILDNSPASYIFHNANAVPVSTWFNDPHDTELTDLVPFLEDLTTVDDVTLVLDNNMGPNIVSR